MLNKLKRIAKELLAIKWVREFYEKITKGLLELLGANRFLAALYGIAGLLTFSREQFAVLRGRRNYYRNLKKDRLTHVELRRNIHRLEKGIQMQPRRDSFAADYIGETVEFYAQSTRQCSNNPGSMDMGEIEWAHSVLREYFSIVKIEGRVKNAYDAFVANNFMTGSVGKVPFERATTKKSSVTYDELLQLSLQRRSVRWFEQKPVPRELIDKALLVGRQSPTACNRMPYEFKIFDDPEMVKKVAGIPFGAAGYAHNIPTVIVVVGKLNSYFSPRDRHVIYVDAALASMPFMLALETLGLASSVINWPDFEPLERKMQKTLGLGYDERVIMLMAVGYPDPKGLIAYSQKKELDTIRTYNALSQK